MTAFCLFAKYKKTQSYIFIGTQISATTENEKRLFCICKKFEYGLIEYEKEKGLHHIFYYYFFFDSIFFMLFFFVNWFYIFS